MTDEINKHNNTDIHEALWNENDSFDNDTYNNMMLEQYKAYVNIADRVSARRSVAHVFFITLNAFLLSTFGMIVSHQTQISNNKAVLFLTLLGMLVICYAWWRLMQYFRRLTRGKQKVIDAIETRLPMRSFWKAEVHAMHTENPYRPLKNMETMLPAVFAVLYILIYVYVLFI